MLPTRNPGAVMKVTLSLRFTILFILALAAPSFAGISLDDLVSMVESEMDPGLIVSLVERDCVDFEVGPEALIELASRVPREVLQAALDCSAAAKVPESKECRIYRAAAANPSLVNFPFFISSMSKRPLVIYWMSSGMWVDERKAAGARLGTFKLIKEHVGKHMELVQVLNGIPGVGAFEFHTHPHLATGEDVRTRQRQAILDACTARARLALVSEPSGSEIFIDGKLEGVTPLDLEILSGEHELVIESPTYASHVERILLREGELRRLRVELDPLARLAVSSQPLGAIVLLNGEVEGKAPIELYLESGDFDLELIQPQHRPHRQTVTVDLGELVEISPAMEEVADGSYCHDFGLSGPVERGIKPLAEALVGKEMTLTTPLYKVITSTMGSDLGATHVVDAKHMLFAAKLSRKYTDQPWELLGRELGGWAFGETASDVRRTPRGGVTITEVAKKKSSIVVHVLHDNGQKNAIYFDFTRNLKNVTVADLTEALCVVFTKHEDFTA